MFELGRLLWSGLSVQLPNLFQKYNHSRQGHQICWVPSRMKCDGIEGDQNLDCFSVYMACPTRYFSFELNVAHSLRAGSVPGLMMECPTETLLGSQTRFLAGPLVRI